MSDKRVPAAGNRRADDDQRVERAVNYGASLADSRLARAAHVYAERLGWRVGPLHEVRNSRCTCKKGADCRTPGKHPRYYHGLYEHGVHSMTTDVDMLETLWKRWPRANVGAAPGDGFVVLDIDPRNGGDDALAEVEREHGPLPETPTVLSGGGGEHRYFATDEHVPNAPDLAPGIELKSAGTLVVCPPSLHESGRHYEWETSLHVTDIPLAPLPDWIIERAFRDQSPRPALGPGWAAEWFRTPLESGNRRGPKGLPRIVGYLRGHGIDCETCIAILECWDAQNVAPLGADEIRKHVEGMYQRYGMPATITINNRRVTRTEIRTEARHAR